jgi:hypothetical protein
VEGHHREGERHVLRPLAVLAATALAVGLCSSAQAAPAVSVVKYYTNIGPTPVVTPEAAAGSIEVTVTTSGSVAGKSFSRPSVHRVAPTCWYGRGETGAAYYEYWKPGGEARKSATLEAFAAQGLLNPGYEDYATDTTGHWYDATCQFDAPVATVSAYLVSHSAVYVPAAGAVPTAPPEVSAAVLAQVAFDAIDLPGGTIRWNPALDGSGATVVNMDTWAQVDATLADLQLAAPGADPASCPDTGVPWTKDTTKTSCSIRFFHSSANQLVKTGQALPTATLTATATATWTASWTSSLDPATHTPLPTQDLTTTAEIPVAEIQSIVTNVS